MYRPLPPSPFEENGQNKIDLQHEYEEFGLDHNTTSTQPSPLPPTPFDYDYPVVRSDTLPVQGLQDEYMYVYMRSLVVSSGKQYTQEEISVYMNLPVPPSVHMPLPPREVQLPTSSPRHTLPKTKPKALPRVQPNKNRPAVVQLPTSSPRHTPP